MIRTHGPLSGDLDHIEFSADAWQLLQSLQDRLNEMNSDRNSIAYALACKGRYQINERQNITFGQDMALDHAINEPITFIWGPPGTGKTHTLARITCDFIDRGKRVLMLSYSNVSVDGALLRVYGMVNDPDGKVIRYGYPRTEKILNSRTMTSYQYVLHKDPVMLERYHKLLDRKKELKKKDSRLIDINRELNQIRKHFKDREKELIKAVPFVATTVSKALVDSAIYSQRFDIVIFDEASMAYIPQIVFAGGLAKERFCCMGDFSQLPAIVQSKDNPRLEEDIFEYTGIMDAVDRACSHNWLVMLNKQWRMHPEIAEFVNQEMYHGLLRSGENMREERDAIAKVGPISASPMNLLDLSGMYSVCCKTEDGSRINLLSALICAILAEKLAKHHEVGIITPYNAQSRLIMAIIRDMKANDSTLADITCATVHQFQGSEKAIIIYDAVDCFRMLYPGMLLTSMRHETANRLFNVAITRSQGKFIMVANTDFFRRKKISKELLFTKAIKRMQAQHEAVYCDGITSKLTAETHNADSLFYIETTQKEWEQFLTDLRDAQSRIHMHIPGAMDDNEDQIQELADALSDAQSRGVDIKIQADENVLLPEVLEAFVEYRPHVAIPVTLIDKKIIWYGEPSCKADFISEGDVVFTQEQLYIRFDGKIAARSVGAFLKI